VKDLEWWVTFEEHLRAIVTFFSRQEHKDRFLENCLKPNGITLRHSVHSKHIDWRWEVLEEVLEDVSDVWPYLRHFSLERMVRTESGKISNALYTLVAEAYANVRFLSIVQLLRVACERVGHWARWMEGCWCHNDILVDCRTYAQRRAALLAAGVDAGGGPLELSFVLLGVAACRSV